MTWTCLCPTSHADARDLCAACGMDRPPTASATTPRYACHDCHTPTAIPQLTRDPDDTPDPATGRVIERCASCHVQRLKYRAEVLDPISPAALAQCKAALAAAFARADAKWRSHRDPPNPP